MFLFQVTGLNLGNDKPVPFEVDYLRLFNSQQKITIFLQHRKNYDDARVSLGAKETQSQTRGLVFVAAFDNTDEGNTELTIYDMEGNKRAAYCSVDEDMFVTSTVPVEESFETIYVPVIYDDEVVNECIQAFNDSQMLDVCADEMVPAMEEFFIETCLEAVSNNESASTISDLYKLTCAGVTGIDECTFNGTMGMCENDTIAGADHQIDDDTVSTNSGPLIGGITGAIIAAVAAAIILFVVRRFLKKKKEKMLQEGDEDDLNTDVEERDIESAAQTTAPLATTFAPRRLPKQPQLPSRFNKSGFVDKDLFRYDQDEVQAKPKVDPVEKQASDSRCLKLLHQMEDDIDDEDRAMFRQSKEKSLDSINLSIADGRSVATPSNAPSDPDFDLPASMMQSPAPGAAPMGRASKLGRSTPANVEEQLKKEALPDLKPLNDYQDSSDFDWRKKLVPGQMRKLLQDRRPKPKPPMQLEGFSGPAANTESFDTSEV